MKPALETTVTDEEIRSSVSEVAIGKSDQPLLLSVLKSDFLKEKAAMALLQMLTDDIPATVLCNLQVAFISGYVLGRRHNAPNPLPEE